MRYIYISLFGCVSGSTAVQEFLAQVAEPREGLNRIKGHAESALMEYKVAGWAALLEYSHKVFKDLAVNLQKEEREIVTYKTGLALGGVEGGVDKYVQFTMLNKQIKGDAEQHKNFVTRHVKAVLEKLTDAMAKAFSNKAIQQNGSHAKLLVQNIPQVTKSAKVVVAKLGDSDGKGGVGVGVTKKGSLELAAPTAEYEMLKSSLEGIDATLVAVTEVKAKFQSILTTIRGSIISTGSLFEKPAATSWAELAKESVNYVNLIYAGLKDKNYAEFRERSESILTNIEREQESMIEPMECTKVEEYEIKTAAGRSIAGLMESFCSK